MLNNTTLDTSSNMEICNTYMLHKLYDCHSLKVNTV